MTEHSIYCSVCNAAIEHDAKSCPHCMAPAPSISAPCDGAREPTNESDIPESKSAGQPQEVQPQEVQPQEVQPQEVQPQEVQPQDNQPQDNQPQDNQPQDNQPQDHQPQEVQPQEGLIADFPANESLPNIEHGGFFDIKETSIDHTPEEHGLLFLLFSCSGRIRRTPYLLSLLLAFGAYCISFLFVVSFMIPIGAEEAAEQLGAMLVVMSLALLIPATIKRLHDCDGSGWGILLAFVCGALLLPILLLWEGTRGTNQFGRPVRIKLKAMSIAAVALLLACGAYSGIVSLRITTLEAQYAAAYGDYFEDGEPSEYHLKYLAEAYHDDASFRKWWPYDDGSIVRMHFSALGCGVIEYDRANFDAAVKWLKRCHDASDRLKSVRMTPEFESELSGDLIKMQLLYADALTAAGDQGLASEIRSEAIEQGRELGLSNGLDKLTRLDAEGSLGLDNENYDVAEAAYTELIELGETQLLRETTDIDTRSTLAGHYHNRALARIELGNLDGAQADLREAIDIQATLKDLFDFSDSNLSLHFELLGKIFEKRNRLDAALEQYEKAFEADPTNFTLYYRLIHIYYEQFDFDKIIERLDSMLDDKPDRHLEYMLCISLLHENRDVQAARIIKRLHGRHPESIEAQFLYGVLQLKEKKYAIAVESLYKAYQQNPRDPAILFNLVIALSGADRRVEAQRITAELFDLRSDLAERLRRWLQDDSGAEMKPQFELFFNE